jgi:hypothetical protein
MRTTGVSVRALQIQQWPDYWYVLTFALCIATTGAVFALFVGHGWGQFQLPSLTWPQLHLAGYGRVSP